MLCINKGIALKTSDIVPGFLMPEYKESSDSTIPVKPLIETNRNDNNADASWYCNRTKEGQNSVFCNKDTDNANNRESISYNNDKNSDKTSVVDISTTAKTSSDQSALQDQHTKEALQRQQNNLSVPIKPTKNVDVNVGQQQVQIKIKY
jgi:hypothetical protein